MSENRALVRTAASQYGLLTLAQQRAGGLSPQTVRHRRKSGRYERVGRGVDAIAGTPTSWHQAALAALLSAGDDAALSHRTAVHLWGIGTFEQPIELAVRYERAPVVPGAVVHRSLDLLDGDIVVLDGFRVTAVARTFVDVGAVLPAWLVEVLDERALGDQLTESEIEELFGRACRELGVPPPRTQVPVTLDGKDYRLDFAYPERKVAIEINGFRSHTRRRTFENDHERRNALMAAGWRVPEFTRRQLLRDLPHIVRTLHAVL